MALSIIAYLLLGLDVRELDCEVLELLEEDEPLLVLLLEDEGAALLLLLDDAEDELVLALRGAELCVLLEV